jgi:peptidoglycan/xylan/chitin deacetylase (PgdA/CDA1 family)
MKNFIKQVISIVFILFGFVKRQNKHVISKNLITPIYFHDPSKELFEMCIKWLIKNNYHFISTDDLHEILIGNKKVKSGSVCITVDDGKKGNLKNIIPIAEEFKIPITIFISTEPVTNGVFWWSYFSIHNKINNKKLSIEDCKKLTNIDRKYIINKIKKTIVIPREAMKPEDVVRISNLEFVTIGNHTINHPITTSCEIDELEYEITEASKELKSWISKDINYFAYPNGNFDNREIPILSKCGIKLAFTTVPKHINYNETINHFQIPRFCVNDNGSFAENICKMVGVWQKYIK